MTQTDPQVDRALAGGAEPRDGGRALSIQDAIRRAVLEQRLAPGRRLPEDQIGALFGASRTLVRSALQNLTHEGVVTISRNRGALVASPSPDEARHVFDARRTVESVTVARAAARIDSGELAGLYGLLERGLGAVTAGDRGTAIRLSGEFHLAIAASARQPVLYDFLASLISRSSLVIALYGRGFHSACADDEHAGLVAALRLHDAAQAVELMVAHLHHIEADLDLRPADRRSSGLAEALGIDGQP